MVNKASAESLKAKLKKYREDEKPKKKEFVKSKFGKKSESKSPEKGPSSTLDGKTVIIGEEVSKSDGSVCAESTNK